MRLSVRTRAQNALSRDVPRPECAFPSRRGAREVWGNPPPGCGALWRMSQLIASKIVVYGRREKKTIAYPRMSVRPRND